MLSHSLGIWTHLPTHPRGIYMLECCRIFCMELFANCWFLLKILPFLKEEPWRWKIDNFNKCYKLQDYSLSSSTTTTVWLLLWQSLWSSAWRLMKLTFVCKISLPAHLWSILNGSRDQCCSNKCWRNLNPLSNVGCRFFFFSNFVL